MFGLEQFDLDTLLLALAPEVDLRYERLFGYLQDDVTRKRPTVDLAISLLCADDDGCLAARGRFAADAPLLRHRLIHLVADPNLVHPPLLAQFVCPEQQFVRFLLGTGGLHSELVSSCTNEQTPAGNIADLYVPADAQAELARVADCIATQTPLPPVWLHSPGASDTTEAARAVAHAAGVPLLLLDATRVPAHDAERILSLAQREAWLCGKLLSIDHAEFWLDEPYLPARLAVALREPPCPTLLGSTRNIPTELLGVALPICLPRLDASLRKKCWQVVLGAHGTALQDAETSALAARFRLMPTQITAAVKDACLRSHGTPSIVELQVASRAQSGEALATVADKVMAKATWDDLVLPADAIAQLRELCSRVEHHERVFNEWGFGRKLSRGRGTAALFSGGSGTGKTMAAEVIANALGLDLYRIDLARVVNKYIGETEKNLDRVFDAAESANAILFFDEADALFGKRSEVKDAHDRYANIEVSYLLQKMEEYEGVAILASNLPANLDDAFMRRLACAVHFPLPDEAARLDIWQRAWPAAARLAGSVDRHALAHELKIAGGSIKNIALGAAFAAAANGGVIDDGHVAHAVRREYEKSGRSSTLPPRFAALRSGAGAKV
jgi:AAA+ superfamily predicted ATPase